VRELEVLWRRQELNSSLVKSSIFSYRSEIVAGKSKIVTATGSETGGEQELVTREEFDGFAEIQRKLDAFAQGQLEMADVQADTGENLNRVQAETKSWTNWLT
jgi:hypothetical protein